MLSKLSISLLLTLSYVEKVVSCGFTIHMSVTHRAINNYFSGPPSSFETLFVENRGALEGGSPYPDYGYQCGPNHDDGELSILQYLYTLFFSFLTLLTCMILPFLSFYQ